MREGEQLQIVVENLLPEGTTIHWHGVPVPNAMEGVPGLTQDPIALDETFTYTFVAAPSGSYLYHSHVGLPLDRGLLGALIVEETTPHVSYDREYTLVLDDLLPGEPRPLTAATLGMRGMGERYDVVIEADSPGACSSTATTSITSRAACLKKSATAPDQIHVTGLGSCSGGKAASISARCGSSQGGSTSFSPRWAGSSSRAKPGPSVASSKSTPPGSRK